MFFKDCKIRIIFNCYVTDDVDVVPLVVRVFFGQTSRESSNSGRKSSETRQK